MFKVFKQKINDLMNCIQTVDMCQNGLMSRVVRQSYILAFKTTNWCPNNCAHCCETAGPRSSTAFIPETVICDYLTQASQDKKFSKSVIFTGGEITSAYKLVGDTYITNIVDHALNLGLDVNLKTNAAFAQNPSWANRVYSDIETIVKHKYNKEKVGTVKQIIPFEISLSLDRFHRDAGNRNFEFLKHFANTDFKNVAFCIHISSFEQDINMFHELMKKLQTSGVEVSQMGCFDKKMESTGTVMWGLNGNVLMTFSCGILFSGGRARNIPSAYQDCASQFKFLVKQSNTIKTVLAFDANGNVLLGENTGKNISTKWRDNNGDPLPLNVIRNNLFMETYKAEQAFLSQHKTLAVYNKFLIPLLRGYRSK